MGDRGNVVILDTWSDSPVYLYAHSDGSHLGTVVATALARRQRWDDGAYLARIVFSELVRGYEEDELYYGIATAPPDNEHPYLVLDVASQRVLIGDASEPEHVRCHVHDVTHWLVVLPFEDYEELPSAYERAHGWWWT